MEEPIRYMCASRHHHGIIVVYFSTPFDRLDETSFETPANFESVSIVGTILYCHSKLNFTMGLETEVTNVISVYKFPM